VHIAPLCTPLRYSTKQNPMGMFDGTSFPAVYFPSAATPLTRRLLVYFASGAYRPGCACTPPTEM
jgi:hypothetical protein